MSHRIKALIALLLLVPVASVGTLIAMHVSPGPTGQGVFFACKVWLLAMPVTWWVLIDKQKITLPRPTRQGLPMAVGLGVATFVIIIAAYSLLGRLWIDPDQVKIIAHKSGLKTVPIYLAGCLYWCTVNSLLEEYVWRWFVFRKCEALMSSTMAVGVSALLFTLHHIIALDAYFDWRVTVLASLGVLIGGGTWSWLYLRYRSIWPGYVAHVFADVAIFLIGYKLIFM